ncbi:MAG: hypothetical protein AABN34_08510 [Acidobacteriota bacterium]
MSVKPCIALVILLSVANCASQSHGQEPARPAVIGPEAVWKKALPQRVSEKMLLCVRDDPQFDCIATVMRQAGASRQAIAVMRLLKGEGWMFSFKEMGRVDLAEAVYPFRANTNEGVLLVDGTPQVIDVDDLRDFFSNAFAGTRVKAVFEEFEKIMTGELSAGKIAKDLEDSTALFLLLSENMESIPHTRDWVVWESGVGKNKDIWVFEPINQVGRISVAIPFLRHYVLYDLSDGSLGYIRKVIEGYDDSHVLTTGLIGSGIGALLATKDKGGAAAMGGLAGLILSGLATKTERPVGKKVICQNCSSTYSIHVSPSQQVFRCPVCNKYLQLL